MWKPRRLTTLWVSLAYHRDSFAFFLQRWLRRDLSYGIYRRVFRWKSTVMKATYFQAGIFLGFFDPDDGGNMFLRNDNWLSANYTVLYHGRQYCFCNLLRSVNYILFRVSCVIYFTLLPSHRFQNCLYESYMKVDMTTVRKGRFNFSSYFHIPREPNPVYFPNWALHYG
jgi:hypothetical protein